MSIYQLASAGAVIRLSDGAFIPADPLNRDWAAYQDWLAAGNAPQPAPSVEPPTTVSSAAFYDRFTDAEKLAIAAAATASPAIFAGLVHGLSTGEVPLGSATLAGWMDALVQAGAITADRKTAILTP